MIQRVSLSLIYNNSAFKFNRLVSVSDNRSFCDFFLIGTNPFRRVYLCKMEEENYEYDIKIKQ